jgi:hypothetical protein
VNHFSFYMIRNEFDISGHIVLRIRRQSIALEIFMEIFSEEHISIPC